MVLIGILIWWWIVIDGVDTTCSSSIKQGPYTLEKPMLNMTVPTRINLVFQRVWIDKDVELMYRSFWSSVCYMGGNIDPNTDVFGVSLRICHHTKRLTSGYKIRSARFEPTARTVGEAIQMRVLTHSETRTFGQILV